jgi:hypothetical protein
VVSPNGVVEKNVGVPATTPNGDTAAAVGDSLKGG